MVFGSCGFLGSTSGGKEDGEGGALLRAGIHKHKATVRLHRALYDGEAEAGTAYPAR